MKIYTRTGDKGETSLFGGERISKNHLRIQSIGLVDELNCLLGMTVIKIQNKIIENLIKKIQKDLFCIGSHLAKAKTNTNFLAIRIVEMEKTIDILSKEMPQLFNFIIPEGAESATLLFYTRAVTRKAERELVALTKTDKINKNILIYFNRLSDLLYTFGRYQNFKANIKETIWKGK